jgi:hypothetical protein
VPIFCGLIQPILHTWSLTNWSIQCTRRGALSTQY